MSDRQERANKAATAAHTAAQTAKLSEEFQEVAKNTAYTEIINGRYRLDITNKLQEYGIEEIHADSIATAAHTAAYPTVEEG